MRVLLLIILCVANLVALPAFGLLDVQTIKLPSEGAQVFLAHADSDDTADIFILDGSTLNVYPSGAANSPSVIKLPESTSVFDVSDIDRDGANEVIAICGEQILLHEITASQKDTAFEELFRLKTRFSQVAKTPSTTVLTIVSNDKLLLALPCEEEFQLRNRSGELVQSFPIMPVAYGDKTNTEDFYASSYDPPLFGSAESMELLCWQTVEYKTDLPEELNPSLSRTVINTRGTEWQADNAADKAPAAWPWFSLRANDNNEENSELPRVLYAYTRPNLQNTLLRLRTIDENGLQIGTARKYPGRIIVTDKDLPDFNGDGYVDTLFWKAPNPGMSVNAITRVVTGSQWPLRLTVHMFDPEKKRYSARPATVCELKVPVMWFFDGVRPLKSCVLRDLNGDGRTDLGCKTAPDTFAIWLFNDKGFNARPDFTRKFTTDISHIEFHEELSKNNRTSIGLRSKKALYVIRIED